MSSAYKLLRLRCGLSIEEAAEFHGTRTDSVNAWSSGRRAAPPGVLNELRQLYRRIADLAISYRIAIEREINAHVEPQDILTIAVAATDDAARLAGLPAKGAHEAAVGLAIAQLQSDVGILVVSVTGDAGAIAVGPGNSADLR